MIYEDQIRLQVMWLGHRVEVARRVVADAKAKASEHERFGYEAARYLYLVHDELRGLVEGCRQEDLYTALALAEARMPGGFPSVERPKHKRIEKARNKGAKQL